MKLDANLECQIRIDPVLIADVTEILILINKGKQENWQLSKLTQQE